MVVRFNPEQSGNLSAFLIHRTNEGPKIIAVLPFQPSIYIGRFVCNADELKASTTVRTSDDPPGKGKAIALYFNIKGIKSSNKVPKEFAPLHKCEDCGEIAPHKNLDCYANTMKSM